MRLASDHQPSIASARRSCLQATWAHLGAASVIAFLSVSGRAIGQCLDVGDKGRFSSAARCERLCVLRGKKSMFNAAGAESFAEGRRGAFSASIPARCFLRSLLFKSHPGESRLFSSSGFGMVFL